MNAGFFQLSKLLGGAQRIVFFGGAGVSTESGIPDFRSAHGLYSASEGRRYEDMLSSAFFGSYPSDFWDFYRHVMLYPDARPNPAHLALAELEKLGRLSAVITQNIDGLHQLAGSRRVLELHGSVLRNRCTGCGRSFSLEELLREDDMPLCPDCGSIIKPDVVLYGEPLDEQIMEESIAAIQNADLIIVGGTSLVVYPAAGLLHYRRRNTPLVLINRDITPYDGEADLIIRDNIADILSRAVEALLENP